MHTMAERRDPEGREGPPAVLVPAPAPLDDALADLVAGEPLPRLEVRCCCDAGRLLGHLQLAPEQMRAGTLLRYEVPTMLDVTTLHDVPPRLIEGRKILDLEVARLRVTDYDDDTIDDVLAVKSNDHAIEDLRKIPGFTELGS